jgi:hypothetical protein
MSGFLELKCKILRGGMEQYLTPMGPTKLHVHPLFEISPLEPRFSEWLVFEGISVDETGKQHYLDATGATPGAHIPHACLPARVPAAPHASKILPKCTTTNADQPALPCAPAVAYKRAVLDCINYLSKFGYTKEQVGWCGRPCRLVCRPVSLQHKHTHAGPYRPAPSLELMAPSLSAGVSPAVVLPLRGPHQRHSRRPQRRRHPGHPHRHL